MNLGIGIIVLILCLATGYGLAQVSRWIEERLRAKGGEVSITTFSDPGTSIEVDCRGCGQFNRVPSHRLRDRPKCGRCKARLMPGKRLVVCRVSPLDSTLSRELDAVWKDEDRLWQSLADYVTITDKARKEARGESDRVVN